MASRRRHLARTVIALLVAVAMWGGLLQGLTLIARHPRARAWLAHELSVRASEALGQEVRVGDVRLSAFPPRIAVRELEIGSAEAPMLRVEAGEVTGGQFRLADREVVLNQLRLVGVRVRADLAPGAETRDRGTPWVRLLVRQLELTRVEIERVGLPSGIAFEAHDVEARWSGSRRNPVSAAVFHAGSFVLRVPGLEPVAGELAAWGHQTRDGFELRRLRGSGTGWSIDGRVAGTWDGPQVQGSGAVIVDIAELDRLLGIGAGMQGTVDADLTVNVGGDGFRLDAALASPLVEVVGFTLADLQGEAHLTRDGLEGSLARAVFAGGQFEGSYTLSSLGPPWGHRIALRGEDVDLAAFLRVLGIDDAGLAGRCRVNADLGFQGEAIKLGSGTALVDIRPAPGDVPVDGRIVLGLARDGALAISTDDIRLAGAPLHWEGRLTLGTWRPAWSIQGERIRIESVARLLRGWVGEDVIPPELVGEAAIDVRLHGTFDDLTITGDVAAAPVSFGPIDADGLEASFRVGQGVLHLESASVFVGSGRVASRGELRYGEGGALDLHLSGRGVPVARLMAWGGVHGPFAGSVAVDGNLCGTVDAPRADARLAFSAVDIAGVRLGDGSAQLWLDDSIVSVEELSLGPVAASGRIDLRKRTALVDASLRGFALEGISPPLARLAGGSLDCTLHGEFPFEQPSGRLLVATQQGGRGVVEVDGDSLRVDLERPEVWSVRGNLARAGREFRGRLTYIVESLGQFGREIAGTDVPIEGRLEGFADLVVAGGRPPRLEGQVTSLSIAVEGETAELVAPARYVVEGGAIDLAGATLRGPASTLSFHGSRRTDGSLAGSVSGELPAALLGLIWRESAPTGRLAVEVEIAGTDQAPRLEGIARVHNGSLKIPGMPAPVTAMTGTVEFVPEAIKLDRIEFALLGGRGSCSGRVTLMPRLELDLAIHVDRVRWPVIAGLAPILTGDMRLGGPLESLSLTGEAKLERTVYRERLNLQSLVLQEILGPERAAVGEAEPMTFSLLVRVPGTLEVDTDLAEFTARGDLRLVGTSERPGLVGRLEALPGAELYMAGQRYELDRGTVTFSRPDAIEPFLDILARTDVQSFEITVALVGTLDRMTPTFTSNPPLVEMDIISLLSTGKKADDAAQWQAGNVASSFITEQLAGAVSRRARTLLDVDQLRLDPLAESQTGDPTARLTVVKQISPELTVAVSTNLSSNREEVINARWKLGTGTFLEANRDNDGSYSLEVKWLRRY